MSTLRFVIATTTATCMVLGVAGALVLAQSKDKPAKDADAKRPKMTLRVQPQVAIAPAKVTLTAEILGGSDDFEEYYCASVAWDWGDDTTSESTSDCEPYEAGKSQIKRRYTVQHEFRRAGNYKLYFHLKQKTRILGSASTSLQVQPGVGAF